MKKNRRIQSFALLILAAVLLAVIAVLGSFWQEAASDGFTRKIWHRVYNILLEQTGWDVTCSCGQLRDFL